MYLVECLNNDKSRYTNAITNPDICLYWPFEVPLEDVAMIEDNLTGDVILLSPEKTYIIEDLLRQPEMCIDKFKSILIV